MITIKEYLDANGKTSINAVSCMDPLDFEQPVSPAENLIPKRDIPKYRKEPNDVMVAPPEQNGYFPYSAGFFPQDTDIPLGENNPYDGYNTEVETGEISQSSPWSSDTAPQVDSMLQTHWQVKSKAPKVLSESGNMFHPDPIQSIKYVSYLAENSDIYKAALLNELKKANLI
jgi:hypothetical protein